MPVEKILNLIIPGYTYLEIDARSTFEQSAEGKIVKQLAERTEQSLAQLKDSTGFWSMMFTNNHQQKKIALKEEFEKQKAACLAQIEHSESYKNLSIKIAIEILNKIYPDSTYLNAQDTHHLSGLQFTRTLISKLTCIEQEIDQYYTANNIANSTIETLVEQKQQTIEEWVTEFSTNAEYERFRSTIEVQKTKADEQIVHNKAIQLANAFPLLFHKLAPLQQPIIFQLRDKHSKQAWTSEEPSQEILTDLSKHFFYLMNQIAINEMSFINLESFNQRYANKMAAKLLNLLNTSSSLNLETWFENYQTKLFKYLKNEITLIHGEKWEPPIAAKKHILSDALSYLWQNPSADTANKFIRKLGDAHAFMQATSIASKNDNSFLAMLDLYNYTRFKEQIKETKIVTTSLLKPFKPILDEYRDIGLYEKNILWKFLRTLIPIIIIVGCIVAISLLLTPLALPELVFFAALIPEIFIGLGIATLYISVKNDIYRFFRELVYGGAYEIPEFQVNQRMIHAFSNKKIADDVRAFYLSELEYCDTVEKEFEALDIISSLNQQQIQKRNENQMKRNQLCLEWYDIHSNRDIGVDQIPKIVLNTLHQRSTEEYESLKQNLKKDIDPLNSATSTLTQHVKQVFVQHNSVPSEAKSVVKLQINHGLFKPPISWKQKEYIERVVDLTEDLKQLHVKVNL